jgi:hypothetical protein
MGHIRGHGCRDLLVYCESIDCHHETKLNADHLPDETPIRPPAWSARAAATEARTCGRTGR